MQVHDSENYYLRGAIMGYDSYIEIDCRRYSDRIADMIEAFKATPHKARLTALH